MKPEDTEDTEYIDVFLEEKDIFLSVPKEVIKRDKKILNFIFNNLFRKMISSSLCLTLLLPKPAFATYQKDRGSNSQGTQIEKNYESRPYAGLVIDFRPQEIKNRSKLKSLLDQIQIQSAVDSKLAANSTQILKMRVRSKRTENFYEDFKQEKLILPKNVSYKTLPPRIKAPQNFYQSQSSFSNLVPISTLQSMPLQQLNEVKGIIRLKGGFKILTFGVLSSKIMKFIEQKKEPDADLSKITSVKNSRLEKLCLFCFAFISFLVLLISILLIFGTRSKVDAQIILNMQTKLGELYKTQLQLQKDVFQLSENLLEMSRLSQQGEENNSNLITSLSEKLNIMEKLPAASSRSMKTYFKAHFKEEWILRCKKAVFSLILSKEIPGVSELFESLEESGMEEVMAFIETICKGDLRK
jgi:hypothetical protein